MNSKLFLKPHSRNPRWALAYSSYLQRTRTRERWRTCYKAVEGQMAKVRKYMDVHGGSTRDPKYFSARAIVDHRPLEALLSRRDCSITTLSALSFDGWVWMDSDIWMWVDSEWCDSQLLFRIQCTDLVFSVQTWVYPYFSHSSRFSEFGRYLGRCESVWLWLRQFWSLGSRRAKKSPFKWRINHYAVVVDVCGFVEEKTKLSARRLALREREDEVGDVVGGCWASMNDKNSAKKIGRIRLAMSK